MCPEVKTEMLKIPAGQNFRAEDHIDSRVEEIKEWRYGATVSEPNPNRNVATFCQGDYSEQDNAVLSRTFCGFGPKVRIYGFNQDRHVQVDIEGVRHSGDPTKDVIVDIYAEGSFIGTRVIRSDYGWSNNVYTFMVTERAFQWGSKLKLQFRDLVSVDFHDKQTGQFTHTGKVHWIVDAQINGEDVPTIQMREVFMTKYMPNTWVGGIVNSCVSSTPVLK
jgi:hypothetical protein